MSLFSTKNKTGAFISIALIVIVWGSASSVTKYSVETIPAYCFAFLRNAVASVCLLPFFLYQRKKNPSLPLPPFRKMVWMGLTGITFFYLFFNIALYFTTAALGALIQGFIPVAIILLAIFFLKERIRNWQIAGVALSVIGVVMLGFTGDFPGARNAILGNTLMVCAVICWGVYTILAKSLQNYDSIYLATIGTWIGTAALLPAMIIEGWGKELPVITWQGWIAIIYLGLVSSAICYILYNRVVKILPAVQVGNFMNLDPVVGAIIAVLVLHDKVTIIQIIGGLLVLGGVVLTSRKHKGALH
jgi:drug/metabolite transporter (DMT)-like permease